MLQKGEKFSWPCNFWRGCAEWIDHFGGFILKMSQFMTFYGIPNSVLLRYCQNQPVKFFYHCAQQLSRVFPLFVTVEKRTRNNHVFWCLSKLKIHSIRPRGPPQLQPLLVYHPLYTQPGVPAETSTPCGTWLYQLRGLDHDPSRAGGSVNRTWCPRDAKATPSAQIQK